MILSKTSQLSARVHSGDPIRFSFHYNSKLITKFINSLFTKILSKQDMIYLQSTVETIIREMILNAVKANSKRVFFINQNLDINNGEHYALGMETFKSYIIKEKEKITGDLKKNGYKVELYLKKEAHGLRVQVRNNAPLLPSEEERIRHRIEKARNYSEFAEIYMDVSDDQEGEGLGIPLTILFLKNSGIGDDSFEIYSDGKVTNTVFTIPFNIKPIEITTLIREQIIGELNSLPTFPERITELRELCHKPDITFRELAAGISADPVLAASVLKLSNSAGFITSRRVDNLVEAITVIGLKNLESLLITSSTRKILDERFTSFKEVWNHCNKVAFYARQIAADYGMNAIVDRVVLAGLLHDLGKIVLLSTDSELSEKINAIAVKREMRTSTFIEEISIGISHSTIGRMISEKWNLPDYIIEAVTWHHAPLNAGEEFRDIVYVTYLANKLCLLEEKKFDFFYFEDEVLARFKLLGMEDFNRFYKRYVELSKGRGKEG